MSSGPPCLRKCGEMSSGPSAVLRLLLLHCSCNCCFVNGNDTGMDGSCSDSIVRFTMSSSVLLNAGSFGIVDIDWK